MIDRTTSLVLKDRVGETITGRIALASAAHHITPCVHLIRCRDMVLDLDVSGQMVGEGFHGYGLVVDECEGVTAKGSFKSLHSGVIVRESSGVTISSSDFTGIRVDAVKFIDSRDVLIEGNSFADFAPIPTKCAIGSEVQRGLSKRACEALGGVWTDGDHADMIQGRGWSENVTIRHNIGMPGQAVQGVFISDPTGIGHVNVRIEDNLFTSLHPNGIVVDGGTNAVAAGNTILSPEGHPYRPQIRGTSGTNEVRIVPVSGIEAARLAWMKAQRPSEREQKLVEIREAHRRLGEMIEALG